MTKLRPSEPFVYQLRRIGPPASVENVCDVMRLKIGSTKFGRSQTNDFYLDSAHLRNFISRRHAEVVGEIENGEIKFVFHDMGLNGTFINDVRMDGKHILEEGDKITFGHTNGYKIKPGQYAAQSSSEFQFVFEKVPSSDTNSERLYNSECDEEAEEEEEEEEEEDKEKSKDINDSNSTKINSRNVVNNVNKKCKDKVASLALKDEAKNNADITDSEDSDDDNKNENGDTSNMNFSGKESEQIGEETSQNRVNQISSLLSETLPAVDNERSSSPHVPNQSSFSKAKQTKSASSNSKAKSKVSDDFSFSEDSSSDDQKTAVKPKSSATNVKRKRRGPAGLGAKDGKKRKRAKKNESDSSEEDALPDGVEWCEEEYCEADECKKPKGKKVQWVQCDDCDKWYHTVCVGTSYDKVKDTDIHFNCGFCE
ncbi:hypothetical protein ACJMK2_008610 [Sinanodonta woodiana]|uniref:FHA domain-containing protein n=1 Tax=Sinanodonta woodiana TaxID=1069815 RepID=A0ABD3VM41_SINWO